MLKDSALQIRKGQDSYCYFHYSYSISGFIEPGSRIFVIIFVGALCMYAELLIIVLVNKFLLFNYVKSKWCSVFTASYLHNHYYKQKNVGVLLLTVSNSIIR